MEMTVIGLDYGTDSVRAILIDAESGKELSTAVHWYARWKDQKYCNPSINQFRQHPLDHLEGLEHTIKEVVKSSGVNPSDVKGICIDTTGSSPMPISKDGISLVLLDEFKDNPNAMMVLWKDHTSIAEAEKINEVARSWGGIDYTKYVGGIYSSEWFWAKIWHVAAQDKAIQEASYTWMEHCDWLTFSLIENKDLASFKRSRCAAGHKAMWHESWGGLPDKGFLRLLHPYLAELRDRLYNDTYTSDTIAGNLSTEWATKLGLTTSTVIAVGTFDAHSGAIGAGIKANSLVRIMGTSTCDIMVADPSGINDRTIRGICGQVDGSVIPGLMGLEAGQSGFGDVLAWFKDLLTWPMDNILAHSIHIDEHQKNLLRQELNDKLIIELTNQAQGLSIDESLPVALDWINGRRTPDANQNLKMSIAGLSLGSKAPHIFKALMYAICFGSKKILDRFESEGVPIESVIGIGGVARKSKYIMQLLADTLNKPIEVATSDYAPALGAGIYAAVAARIYPDVNSASQVLASQIEATYQPNENNVKHMQQYFEKYNSLADFVENTLTANYKKSL
jgi:L-ribulokinase